MPADVCGHGIELDSALEASVLEAATSILEAAGREDWELSVALTNDVGIQALNHTWREKDKPTDVLSFPQDVEGLLGDLVISVETAAVQATTRGHSLESELRILLVHGFLHLCGHDHEAGGEEHAAMVNEERRLMKQLDWSGEGLISLAEAE